MKRNAPFNPVYPYGFSESNTLPPFFSHNGFTESPPGTLAIKIAPPLTFNPEGDLALSVGSGLRVNTTGQIESTSTNSALPPLSFDNGQIVLKTDNSLTVHDDILGVNLSNGLQLGNNGVEVPCISPIILEENKIKLDLDENSCLVKKNEKLTINVTLPLAISNNSLCLQYHSQNFKLVNDWLTVRTAPPMEHTSSGITIALGGGVKVYQNRLYVKTGHGLLINENNEVQLQIGNGLQFSLDGILQINAGEGLQTDYNAVGISCSSPLYVDSDNKLKLKISGSNLNIVNGALQADMNIYSPFLSVLYWPSKNAEYLLNSVNYDLIFYLQMTKIGSQVIGVCNVKGNELRISHAMPDPINISITFNEDGTINRDKSSFMGSIAIKTADSQDLNTTDFSTFMPNKNFYVDGAMKLSTAYIFDTTATAPFEVWKRKAYPCLFKACMQYDITTKEYLFNFVWSDFTNANILPLHTSTTDFTYFVEM